MPKFFCAGFTIAWFLLSLFGFAVQTRISKSDDDGKDNLSSTINSYDDVFAIGENVTSLCTVAKFNFRNERPALTKMAKKARGKSKRKRNQQTSRKKSGKKQKYSKVEFNARNDMV